MYIILKIHDYSKYYLTLILGKLIDSRITIHDS